MGLILKRESVFDICLLAQIILSEIKDKDITLDEVDESVVQKKYDECCDKLDNDPMKYVLKPGWRS